VSQYQNGKTNLHVTEARDSSEWQWHQLGHMQVCTSLQTTTPASGVNPNIFLGGDRRAEGAEGVGSTKGGVRNFFLFWISNGDLWCILSAIFCSSAKTLRGRKDTLAQVYFYWGGAIAPTPAAIDATDTSNTTLCFLQAG